MSALLAGHLAQLIRVPEVTGYLLVGVLIGPATFDMIFQAYSTTLIGEWTFSQALFPDFQPDDEKYLAKVVGIFKLDSRAQWRHLRARYCPRQAFPPCANIPHQPLSISAPLG